MGPRPGCGASGQGWCTGCSAGGKGPEGAAWGQWTWLGGRAGPGAWSSSALPRRPSRHRQGCRQALSGTSGVWGEASCRPHEDTRVSPPLEQPGPHHPSTAPQGSPPGPAPSLEAPSGAEGLGPSGCPAGVGVGWLRSGGDPAVLWCGPQLSRQGGTSTRHPLPPAAPFSHLPG